MPVLSAYVSGVSTTGIEFINEAVSSVFGENAVNVIELGTDSLRYKVRLGSRDSSVVLVILDTVSMETCKDIEDGLFSSDKFYNYVNDEKLVQHLNSVYGLSLKIEDTYIPEVSFSKCNISDKDNTLELVERLKSQLSDKDGIIRTLNYHIKELEGVISGCGYSEEIKKMEDLQSDNLSLKDAILDLNSTIEGLKKSNSDKEVIIQDLENSLSSVNANLAKSGEQVETLNNELSEERVLSSKKSGVIRDKDKNIESLTCKVADLTGKCSFLEGETARLREYESLSSSLRSTIDSLNIDISSKDSEIARLKLDLSKKGESNANIEEYKALLSEANLGKSSAEKALSEANSRYSELSSKYSDVVNENSELNSKVESSVQSYEELLAKYEESEGYLAKVNEDNINLKEKVRVLEKSTDRDIDTEALIFELNNVKRKYASLQTSIFSVLSTKALPYSGIGVPLFKGIIQNLSNVQFLFSGSTESRKGTYKHLFNILANSSSEKYLIVDVTSETAMDYVFQIKKVTDGMEWFSVGGGINKYLSSTCLPNVKALLPKIGYINDAFFLNVDWGKRLVEMDNSGYKVVMYCGDISNLVSRVLFESFSKVGDTTVCVHGNAIGSRSIITNSNGLSGIKNSKVCYYDYDKNMQAFFDIMSKKCNCSITSYARDIK